jgi:hypothetical protein
MIWRVLFLISTLFLAGAGTAEAACVENGGYPFVPLSCLHGADLNAALESSVGPLPPQNLLGQGAKIGKWWMDTSTGVTTPHLRQCINGLGCGIAYVSTDWLDWGVYSTAGRTFALSSSVSGIATSATAPITYVANVIGLSIGSNFAITSNQLHLAAIPAGSMIGNSTSGSAEPTSITGSAYLDQAFGTTGGRFLIRGGATWGATAPSGDITFDSSAVGTIANGAVSNAKMANASANTIKGNPTSGSATVQDFAVPSCPDSAGNHLNYTTGSPGTISCGNSVPNTFIPPPEGRLTLTSGTPVLTSTVSGATSSLYTPSTGAFIPLYNGSSYEATQFSELSNVLANAVVGNAGPFAAAANAVYDMYVWSNGGTVTLTRSDLWQQTATVTNTNASPAVFTHTTHGLLNGSPVRLACTGGGSLSANFTAGTTYYAVSVATNTYQLAATVGGAAINAGGANTCGTTTATEGIGIQTLTTNTPALGTTNARTRVNGLLLNNASITNGPAASRGTYVGSIQTNAAGTIDYIFGGSASGGTAAVFNVFNAYNRHSTKGIVTDSGTSYTLTSSTVRQARASAGMQVSYLIGLVEDGIDFTDTARGTTAAATGSFYQWGVGLDSITAFNVQSSNLVTTSAAVLIPLGGTNAGTIIPTIGGHVISANEASDGTNAATVDTLGNNVLSVTIWN